MTSPSSTSSSDEPTRVSPSGKRALLLCLGVLLLLEFGVARRDWIWRLDPRRPVGILLAVEDEIIDPAGDVRVVALGSSVMRDALLPRAFEQAARLPDGSVLNLSLPNATPFDFVLLYERNRDVISRARLLLVGIEDWFFYEEPGVSERYHRWAGLRDRLADYEGSERLPLLVSWGWKTYAARRAFAIDGLAAATRGERADVIGDDGRTRWRPEEQETGTDTFELEPYEARLRERQWRDRQVRYLRQLVERAASDGVPVAIVRMPMRAAAFRLREQMDPEAESRLQRAMAAAMGGTDMPAESDTQTGADAAAGSDTRGAPDGAAAAAVLLDFPTGAAAGLEERLFLDERHLGTRGARAFSRVLAEWAAANHALR